MFKKLSISLITLIAVLSFANLGYGATIYQQHTISISPGEWGPKSSDPVYLYSGQVLGIYVDEKSTNSHFIWNLIDGNGVIVRSGDGDANFRTGAPVGEYRLYFFCNASNDCSASGIISTQSP